MLCMTGQKLRVRSLESQRCTVALAMVISLDFNIAAVPGTVLGADERTELHRK